MVEVRHHQLTERGQYFDTNLGRVDRISVDTTLESVISVGYINWVIEHYHFVNGGYSGFVRFSEQNRKIIANPDPMPEDLAKIVLDLLNRDNLYEEFFEAALRTNKKIKRPHEEPIKSAD